MYKSLSHFNTQFVGLSIRKFGRGGKYSEP